MLYLKSYLSVNSAIRFLGIFVLVFISVQKFPRSLYFFYNKHSVLPASVRVFEYLDEMFILISLVALLTFKAVSRGKYSLRLFPFSLWILSFVYSCFFLIIINNVPLLQGVVGCFDYVKNIVVIFIFAWLFYTRKSFFSAVNLLILLTVFLGIVGISAELVALFTGKGIGLFVAESGQRFGMYRVHSLVGKGSWNYLGIYATLIFFLARALKKHEPRANIYFVIIGVLIFLTFSRQAWLSFFILLFLQSKKKLLVSMILLFILANILIYSSSFLEVSNMDIRLDQEKYFRYFTFLQSLQLFQESPLTGVGPGMFGGVVSVMFQSPVYDSWPIWFRDYVYNIRSVDLFWPSLLADTGIIGTFFFCMIFVSLYRFIRKASIYFRDAGEFVLADIGRVLYLYIFALAIMAFVAGFNSALVTYSYFALVGMYLSIYDVALSSSRSAVVSSSR